MRPADPVGARNLLAEWAEVVVHDRNHPLTRALDPTRPLNDASGYVHVRTDLWTVHSYLQPPEDLRRWLAPGADGVRRCYPDREVDYTGLPCLIDEFGGIKWIPPGAKPWTDASWGYGEGPKTEDELYAFDRSPKFDVRRIRAIFGKSRQARPAATA